MAGYPEKSVSNISSIRGGKVFSVKLGDLTLSLTDISSSRCVV